MRGLRLFVMSLILLALIFGGNSNASACPLCGPATPSLAEEISSFQTVVLVKFVNGEKPDRTREFPGVTRFEVVEVVKDEETLLQKGTAVTLNRYRDSEQNSLVLFMGNRNEGVMKWSTFIDMTPVSFQYLSDAPGEEATTAQRLVYFLKFLEHSDPIIAADAFSEFAIAPYKDIAPLHQLMEPNKLREWLRNPKDPADRFVRLGLYGLMLGLSGTERDAEFLKSLVVNPTEDYQFGIDGMTAGYLTLTGEDGLAVLEKEILANPDFGRTRVYPVMEALRFVWSYEGDRFSKEQLRSSMRLITKRPGLADLAIIDLARWKDWDAMDEIVSLYGKGDYDVPAIKRAILRFLMTAEKTSPGGSEVEESPHVAKAQIYLKRLQEEDPKTYQAAARYFFE